LKGQKKGYVKSSSAKGGEGGQRNSKRDYGRASHGKKRSTIMGEAWGVKMGRGTGRR